ncbi:hypothetical protein LNP04_12265 [Chryseobacterium sp. C-71]|uniref:hypothetical protein n=1 Tax=Chryseobacterium sp. C-71 TaxID=2893882 RepID=UPI001E2F3677|nr:hypothetical protein [Chryseobacterium sp. C-71]UFH30749.1 hypothetical protein LNP04_12265 [Chryseobacterium sp. C-71]
MENNINRPSFNKFSKNKWKELSKNQEENIFTTYSERELANKFYGGVPDISTNNYNVYTDDETLQIDEKKIDPVFIPNYKSKFDDIVVNIYMAKNGLQLLSMYNSFVPTEESVNIFLEIHSDSNVNTIMRVKVSPQIKDVSKIPIVKLQYLVNMHNVRITTENFKDLIEKEALANRESFLSWLLQVKDSTFKSIVEFFQDVLFDGLGDFFEEGIAKNIQKLRLEEVDWNPAVENYKPFIVPPVVWDNLKPFYNHSVYDEPQKNFNAGENIIKGVFDKFFEIVDTKKAEFTKVISTINGKLPESFSTTLHKISQSFLNGLDSLKGQLQQYTPYLQFLAAKSISCVNALLCGVYNSLIDIIAGIFSIIALLFKGLATLQDIQKDPSIVADYVLEFFEQFSEAMEKFEIDKFLFEWISFQITTAQKIYQWLKAQAPNISLEQVFYYVGYIIGLIIDIILETLLTGGTAAAVRIIDKTLDFMRSPLKKMQEAMFAGISFTGGLLVSFIDFVSEIFTKLKKGAKALFDELKIWIEEIFNVGMKLRDFLKEAYEDFFGQKSRDLFEKIGLRPTKYENGVFNMCPIK